MRTIILLLVLISFPSILFSQTDVAFSEIVFYWNKGGFKTAEVLIEINKQDVTTLTPKTVVRHKVFSKGNLNLRAAVTNVAGFKTKQFTIEINDSQNLFFEVKPKMNKATGSLKVFVEEKSKEEFESEVPDISSVTLLKNQENIQFPYVPGSIQEANRAASGTGFLITNEGHIITNFHVVDGAEEISIKGFKGDFSTSFEAEVISSDRQNDLAILKLKSSLITFDQPPYQIKSSKEVVQAEEVFALGYPIKDIMGEEIKVTSGIINSTSGLKGSISEFQISAEVQPGNSGGPLFDKDGRVIGIVKSKLKREIAESVGYAIKSDYLMFFLSQAGIEGYSKETSENPLAGKDLPEMVKSISDYVFIIESD